MKYEKVKSLPKEISEVVGKNFIITSNHVNDSTHTYHKYPAKFIPHIPRWAIGINKKRTLIIDPFCGSGTTNLEALRLGYPSYGFDIDPLALLIAKVKTTPIDPRKILKYQKIILKEIASFKSKNPYPYPTIENIDHWFSPISKKKLGFLKQIILRIKERDIRDFFLITFSSIIREVSLADNQSQKTYVSHTHKKTPPEVFNFFMERLKKYTQRMEILYEETLNVYSKNKPGLIKIDSRKIHTYTNIPKNIPKLIVTSPPYIKAIDYIYNQLLEYFWLGDILDIKSIKEINHYKENYIGTKQVYSSSYKDFDHKLFGIAELDNTIKKLRQKDKKHAYITYTYFHSMKENLSSCYKILSAGEYYVMVIGNTSVSGLEIPTDVYLSEIAKKIGYKFQGRFLYKIRNRYMRFDRKGKGGFVNDDIVIILNK